MNGTLTLNPAVYPRSRSREQNEDRSNMQSASKSLIVLAYAAMCLIWGSTWIMIKLGLKGAPPITAVAVRFIIAAAVIFFIITLRRIKLPRDRKFWYLSLFLSVFHAAAPYVLVYWGEQYISSGLTAVLFGTLPIGVAIFARFILQDPLTARKLAGVLVGFVGVWVIFSDSVSFGGTGAVKGIIACLVSASLAGFASVIVKKYAQSYNPFVMILFPFGIGGLLALFVAIPLERSNPVEYDALTWFTILYLAVVGTVIAFAIFFWIIKKIDVTVLSYQTFIIPVLAVLIGWIFLDETVTIHLAAGTGLIVAGIALATIGAKTTKTGT